MSQFIYEDNNRRITCLWRTHHHHQRKQSMTSCNNMKYAFGVHDWLLGKNNWLIVIQSRERIIFKDIMIIFINITTCENSLRPDVNSWWYNSSSGECKFEGKRSERLLTNHISSSSSSPFSSCDRDHVVNIKSGGIHVLC